MTGNKTTTTIMAHSLQKGDMIELSATPLFIHQHPRHVINVKEERKVRVVLTYLPTGNQSAHEFDYNGPVKYLVGCRSGGNV